jgi:hypothetical protein
MNRTLALPLLLMWLPFAAMADDWPACGEQSPPVYDQSRLTDTARLLAGFELAAGSELAAEVPATALARHRDTLGTGWSQLRERQLDAVSTFARSELGAAGSAPTRVWYPFSGPDALYLLRFFPDTREAVMTGLEPVGPVPVLTGLSAKELVASLAEIRKSLYAVLSFSFFRTNDLQVDLKKARFPGVTPLLFVFLAEAGYAIVDVHHVRLDAYGEVCVATPDEVAEAPRGIVPGVVIDYFLPGEADFRRLWYFAADLSDNGLKRTPQYLAFVQARDPEASFIKSASYLMHKPYFSTVRAAILAESEVVVQEDSGIPHAWFQPRLWEATLYGRYGSPIALFANWQQVALKRDYGRMEVRALPFGIGYRHRRNDSNLQVYRRRIVPDAPAQGSSP